MDRRQFICTSAWTIGAMATWPLLPSCQVEPITFGWLTDIHYAKAKMKWNRYFRESKNKLSEAILLYNQLKPDFLIETGDFKDENASPEKAKTIKYLEEIEQVFSNFKGPRYHVLGNHDLDGLSKSEFQQRIVNTGIDKNKTYYSFTRKGWHFIVLDACFRSDGEPYDSNNFEWFDTAIPKLQLDWLQNILEESSAPAIVFTHQPLDGKGDLYVNNADEVRLILEQSKKVKAVFQGHIHEGGYRFIEGIHHLTQKAMVDFSGMTNSSYSMVELLPEGTINIKGYRRAESYILAQEELAELGF